MSSIIIPFIPNIDQVFVLLKYNGIKLLLACVYIPPNSHLDLYKKHCEIVENFYINFSIDQILIIGDFNLNKFSSSDYSFFTNTSSHFIVNSYINYLNLNQVNYVKNNHDSILDLIFMDINIDSIFSNWSLIPLFDSYHPPLEFIYPLKIAEFLVESISQEFFNYNSCNFMEIIAFLENIDIMSNIKNLKHENSVLKFYEILNHTFCSTIYYLLIY